MKNIQISPSILSADFSQLGKEIKRLEEGGADLIHVDVMDNHYVPNLSFGPLVCKALKKGNVKIVFPMILALLVTIPIGFYFVVSLDPEIIRIVISVMVILMVALLASGWKPKGEINLLTMILGGGFSGLVNGAAGVGGPPFVTVLMARNDDAEITRSNIIITMGCMSLLTTLTQVFYGMMTLNLVIVSIFAFPIYIGFTWLGATYFNKSGNEYFRKAALLMLISIAIITIIINI